MWVQYWYMYTCLHIDIYKYTYPLIRNRHADQFSTVSFFEFNLNNSNITHCNICMYLASFQAFCFAIGLASGLTKGLRLTWRGFRPGAGTKPVHGFRHLVVDEEDYVPVHGFRHLVARGPLAGGLVLTIVSDMCMQLHEHEMLVILVVSRSVC